MNTEKKLPERKQIRLKEFDYRSVGAYFITICSEKRQPLLSSVHVLENGTVKTELTDYGKIAEEQMMALEVRYSCLTVEHYVIMPDHIHFILSIREADSSAEAAGASPRPTIMDVICAYKSLTTRECRKNGLMGKLFQTSFYEHVIRNQLDYRTAAQYIEYNPARWYMDHKTNEP